MDRFGWATTTKLLVYSRSGQEKRELRIAEFLKKIGSIGRHRDI
jgi:hypothetical protein